MIFRFFSLFFLTVLGSSAFAALPLVDSPEHDVLGKTGQKVWLRVVISVPADAYVYSNPKGPGTGKPLSLEISDPSRIVSGKPLISIPQQYRPIDDDTVYIHKTSFTLAIPVSIPSAKSSFVVNIAGLMCTDRSCTPFSLSKHFTVMPADETAGAFSAPPSNMIELGTPPERNTYENVPLAVSDKNNFPSFSPRFLSERIEGIFFALLFGFLAGLFLNVMPCVLPVLALKITGIVKTAHNRKQSAEGALFYSLGILFFFAILSLLTVSAGYRWGSFFQSSRFLIMVILVLFSMALSLLGLYTIQVPSSILTSASSEKRSFLLDSFSKGFLAAILATPCTGPFLGSVLAWSLTQSIPAQIAVFFSIGLGLAFPFILAAFFPALTRFIPKPGKWMVIFEQLMGITLIGSAVYFTVILGRPYYLPVMLMILISFAGLWQFGRWGSPVRPLFTRRLSLLFLVLLLTAAITVAFSMKPDFPSKKKNAFSIDLLKDNAYAGRLSVVVFTADWCPNCRLVEKTVLDSAEIQDLFHSRGISLLYADITEKGTEGEELLTKLGGTAIPFLAVFPSGNDFASPVCIRDLYTKSDVLEAVKKAEK